MWLSSENWATLKIALDKLKIWEKLSVLHPYIFCCSFGLIWIMGTMVYMDNGYFGLIQIMGTMVYMDNGYFGLIWIMGTMVYMDNGYFGIIRIMGTMVYMDNGYFGFIWIMDTTGLHEKWVLWAYMNNGYFCLLSIMGTYGLMCYQYPVDLQKDRQQQYTPCTLGLHCSHILIPCHAE